MNSDPTGRRIARYQRFLDDSFLLALRGAARSIRVQRTLMAEAAMLHDRARESEERLVGTPQALPLLSRLLGLTQINVALTEDGYRMRIEDLGSILERKPWAIGVYAEQERPLLEQELANLRAGDEPAPQG